MILETWISNFVDINDPFLSDFAGLTVLLIVVCFAYSFLTSAFCSIFTKN